MICKTCGFDFKEEEVRTWTVGHEYGGKIHGLQIVHPKGLAPVCPKCGMVNEK